MSTELQLLLNGLLQTDLTRRLGCLRSGVSDVKQHVWFNDVDWINIYYKKVCLAVPRALLPPASESANAFGRVCLSVCPVRALTFQSIELETSLSVYGYILRTTGSNSRSSGQGQGQRSKLLNIRA